MYDVVMVGGVALVSGERVKSSSLHIRTPLCVLMPISLLPSRHLTTVFLTVLALSPPVCFPSCVFFFVLFFSRRLWLRCLSCTWNWVSSLERDSTLLHHFLHFYRGRKCKGVLSHLSIPYHSSSLFLYPPPPPPAQSVWVCFLISAAERQRVLKSGCIQDLTPTDQACRGPPLNPRYTLTGGRPHPSKLRFNFGRRARLINQGWVARSCGTKHSVVVVVRRIAGGGEGGASRSPHGERTSALKYEVCLKSQQRLPTPPLLLTHTHTHTHTHIAAAGPGELRVNRAQALLWHRHTLT